MDSLYHHEGGIELNLGDGTVLLVRHGKTEFNGGDGTEPRLKGTKYDLPLTPEGVREAKKAAAYIATYPVSAIHHSAMLRASQTAKHLSDATGVQSIVAAHLDPLDVGFLSGWTRKMARSPLEFYIRNSHRVIPGSDNSYDDWYNRYETGLLSEMRKASDDPSKARVLVSHSCNAMAAKSIVKGDDHQFYGEHSETPGGVIIIRKSGGKWSMRDAGLDG